MAWFRAETNIQAQMFDAAVGPTRLVLRGRIVTMDAVGTVLPDGLIAIEGNRIVHMGPWTSPLPVAFANVQIIDTTGTMYPGLIELHNHPSYNAIPLWQVPQAYSNRKAWRADAGYQRRVSAPASLLTHDPTSDIARAVIRFVECRALLGGVTTTQGLSISKMDPATKTAYRGLVRNLELPDEANWPDAIDQINDFASTADANRIYGPLLNDARHRFVMHLSEGVDQEAQDVFEFLRAPDNTRLIGRNFVGVHGTGLNQTQIQALTAGAGLVWSPLSNFLLYGATTDVATAKAAGVILALGSDWGPSGSKNLLGELKIAKKYSDHHDRLFNDLELARMVTSNPASMIGWDQDLGSLETGKIADILILDNTLKEPYSGLIDATETDMIAVIIDGRPCAGRASLIDPLTPGVELIRIAHQDIVLDITDSPTHPLANMTLSAAIHSLSYSLEHLPDLAAKFAQQHGLVEGRQRLSVHLDMDEELAMQLVAGTRTIAPGDVDSMELDPITAIDDTTFKARLSANPNLPDWLRVAL